MSETSWGPSQSTARTTPPPRPCEPPIRPRTRTRSHPRGVWLPEPVREDTIVAADLRSRLRDGRADPPRHHEGLFIDDDVRGVAQREWDVKAWTLKMVEVWCPAHSAALANSGNPIKPSGANLNNASFLHKTTWRSSMTAGRGGEPRPLTDVNADAYLADMLDVCKGTCRLGQCDSASATASSAASPVSSATGTNKSASAKQTGEWRHQGTASPPCHRQGPRGQTLSLCSRPGGGLEGGVGLQRLRKGTQVRSLGSWE